MKTGAIAGWGVVVFSILLAYVYSAARFDWNSGYATLRAMCHQESERCFAVSGIPLALCARRLGIYFGLGLGCFLYWAKPFRVRGMWVCLVFALIVNAIEFGMEWIGHFENAKGLRLTAGLLLGISIPLFIFSREESAAVRNEVAR